MTLFQALLIGLFAYAGAKRTPWFFGVTGGFNMIGRPLVAGLIVGIILGDVTTGVIAGVMVQALYIGQITPGGAMPSDVNWAGYIGIPLAMVAGGGGAEAVALSVPFSMLGLGIFNFLMSFNTIFPHMADKSVEKNDTKGMERAVYLAAIPSLILRAGSVMLICYFGAPFAEMLLTSMPASVLHFFAVAGRMLPAVGFAMLLSQTVKELPMLLFFLMGWVLIGATSMTTTALTLFAAGIAYLYIVALKEKDILVEGPQSVNEEEDDNYEE
jgi:PTS system mannose-specific IIC component